MIAATKGVLVFSLIADRKLNSKPSLDIAYNIRGIGNKHPIKLQTVRKIMNNALATFSFRVNYEMALRCK